jgi:multicomponent Na+:H+ antiporter subunit B
MIRKLFTAVAIVLFLLMVLPLLRQIAPFDALGPVAESYAEEGPESLGAANLVTSVIVTYRGLDTLGEVTVLFIATAGVGFLLRRDEEYETSPETAAAGERGGESALSRPEAAATNEPDNGHALPLRECSEILCTGSRFLVPLLLLFGTYIFTHGHLTPGGGFQGGVVIASGMLLLMLSRASFSLNHGVVRLLETLSGFGYVLIGVLGLVLAAGFLDNRILPLGEYGRLLSAGAIPLIYSLIGLKVGTELSNILDTMKRTEEEL